MIYAYFGPIMLVTRFDKVGEATVMRDTSTVFAALIGWWVLGEKVGAVRGALIGVDRRRCRGDGIDEEI